MGWTKKEYIVQAFEEIGLAAYVYDLTPEQLQSALRRLDSMMAGWNTNGICIGWALPSKPDLGDIDTQTNAPDIANEAIYLNLAVRLASGFGKTASPELKQLADSSYSNLLNQTIEPPPERQLPNTTPRGAGNKPWRNLTNPFVPKPQDDLDAGEYNSITLE